MISVKVKVDLVVSSNHERARTIKDSKGGKYRSMFGYSPHVTVCGKFRYYGVYKLQIYLGFYFSVCRI